jgi:DNA gyrase/topoisomerase IV subunit A
MIDTCGKVIRLSPAEIRTMGRQAKGVRLIRLEEGRTLASVVAFTEETEDESGSTPDATGEKPKQKADETGTPSALDLAAFGIDESLLFDEEAVDKEESEDDTYDDSLLL